MLNLSNDESCSLQVMGSCVNLCMIQFFFDIICCVPACIATSCSLGHIQLVT